MRSSESSEDSLLNSGGYLLLCYRYIELTPVRASMIVHPEDYHWFSCRSNAMGGRYKTQEGTGVPGSVYLIQELI